MTLTEITTGNSGNGNTDILKALITRKHLFIPISVCAYCSILSPRIMNDRSLIFVDELFYLCLSEGSGASTAADKNVTTAVTATHYS
jgi:hypothetical protein